MTRTKKPPCQGVKSDGSRCSSPVTYEGVDGQWWCFRHDPSGEAKAKREAASLRGGVNAAKLKQPAPAGLTDRDLPPLDSPQVAEEWAEVTARAVATGRLSAAAGNAVRGLLSEWLKAHGAGRQAAKLQALTEALAEWRRSGDPAQLLQLVEGK